MQMQDLINEIRRAFPGGSGTATAQTQTVPSWTDSGGPARRPAARARQLYLNSLEHQDHQELADLLHNDPPFHWVLTYDNVQAIRRMYSKYSPRPFELSYSAYEHGVGRELIIFDPRLKVPHGLLGKHNRPGKLRFGRAG